MFFFGSSLNCERVFEIYFGIQMIRKEKKLHKRCQNERKNDQKKTVKCEYGIWHAYKRKLLACNKWYKDLVNQWPLHFIIRTIHVSQFDSIFLANHEFEDRKIQF